MSNASLVSVVIPTYRRPHLVVRAIASVLRQTHRHLEVLVVDDCSPDDTQSVVQSVGDPRVRYIRHETNKGLPAVRNTGIRAARGEYIAFLDDDDEWREDKLEKQLSAIGNYDAVTCTAVVDGGFALRSHRRSSITLDDLRRGGFPPSGLMAKAEVFRTVLFDESLKQGEDWDAQIRIAERYSLGWVPEPLLLYNEGEHARMTNEARLLLGPELEKRNAVLHKHRRFLGERWFNYHLATTYLSYIGSRPNKLECVQYAVRRCGARAVVRLLFAKLYRALRHWAWMNWRKATSARRLSLAEARAR
jgi:GalNAc5-diNAcBac-PP-undecaprenol beta-1,3-glucosyltransferase